MNTKEFELFLKLYPQYTPSTELSLEWTKTYLPILDIDRAFLDSFGPKRLSHWSDCLEETRTEDHKSIIKKWFSENKAHHRHCGVPSLKALETLFSSSTTHSWSHFYLFAVAQELSIYLLHSNCKVFLHCGSTNPKKVIGILFDGDEMILHHGFNAKDVHYIRESRVALEHPEKPLRCLSFYSANDLKILAEKCGFLSPHLLAKPQMYHYLDEKLQSLFQKKES